MTIEPTTPLVADVGPSPPVRSSGRRVATTVSVSLAAIPTVCTLLALRSWVAGRRKLGVALGVGAVLALRKLGSLLLEGLTPAEVARRSGGQSSWGGFYSSGPPGRLRG